MGVLSLIFHNLPSRACSLLSLAIRRHSPYTLGLVEVTQSHSYLVTRNSGPFTSATYCLLLIIYRSLGGPGNVTSLTPNALLTHVPYKHVAPYPFIESAKPSYDIRAASRVRTTELYRTKCTERWRIKASPYIYLLLTYEQR